MITIFREDNTKVKFNTIQFSGGELHPRFTDSIEPGENFVIRADLRSPYDIMELLLITNALGKAHAGRPDLFIPYLPYARQDRVCYEGEALGLQVMCALINKCNFGEVITWDVHSDVATALLRRASNVHQKTFVAKLPQEVLSNCVLVAPDAGARKKAYEVAAYLHLPLVTADKVRNVEDGSITGTKVDSAHIGSKDFLIIDDICDGGRTFIELAKVLRPLTNGKVLLYVTHGIFSKGLEPLWEVIDHIYTPNPWPAFETLFVSLTRISKL